MVAPHDAFGRLRPLWLLAAASCSANVSVPADEQAAPDDAPRGAIVAIAQQGGSDVRTYALASANLRCTDLGDHWYEVALRQKGLDARFTFGRYVAPSDFFTFTPSWISSPADRGAPACRGCAATAALHEGASTFSSDANLSCKVSAEVEGDIVRIHFACDGIDGETPTLTEVEGDAECVVEGRPV